MQWLAFWLVLELVCRADLPGKRTGQFSPRGATAGPAETHRGTRVWLDGQGIPGNALVLHSVDFRNKLGPTTHAVACLLAGLRIGLPG